MNFIVFGCIIFSVLLFITAIHHSLCGHFFKTSYVVKFLYYEEQDDEEPNDQPLMRYRGQVKYWCLPFWYTQTHFHAQEHALAWIQSKQGKPQRKLKSKIIYNV